MAEIPTLSSPTKDFENIQPLLLQSESPTTENPASLISKITEDLSSNPT